MTYSSPADPVSRVVLVVEDEMLIRMVAVDFLTEAGFTVIEAQHADQALAILEAKAAEVHVLFSDIHMPGSIDGLQLVHHAQQHWPWVGLLLASGKAHPMPSELPTKCRFLSKPYEPGDVVTNIHCLAVLEA